jgi:hypothetical protein
MRGYNSFTGGMDDDEDEFGPFGGGGGFRYVISLCAVDKMHNFYRSICCGWHAGDIKLSCAEMQPPKQVCRGRA